MKLNKERKIIKTISKVSVIGLNKQLESKLRQNKNERNSSFLEASKCIVR